MGLIDKVNVKVNGSGDLLSTIQAYTTKILKPNIIDGKNILTKAMIGSKNTKYVIKYDYELEENITIPEGCILEFDGGSINGAYTVTGTNTVIEAGLIKIFDVNVTLEGTWYVEAAYPEWFGAISDITTADCAPAINKALRFSILGRFHKEVKFQGKRYYCKTHVKIEIPSDYYISGNGHTTLVASGDTMDYLFGRDGSDSSDAPGVRIRLSNITFDANYRCKYAVYMPCMSNSNWYNVNCISAVLCNFFTNYSFIDNFYGCKFYSGDSYGHPTKFDVFLGNQDCNALLFSGCNFEGAYIGAYTNSGYNVVFSSCTFEGLRATGVYVNKTECCSIENCYFEDVSWGRETTDTSSPKYINPSDLGIVFSKCYQYTSSRNVTPVERTITPIEIHANIIHNNESLLIDSNLKELIISYRYASALLKSGRMSERMFIIKNNTFQHIKTKNISNDCNLFDCGSECLSVKDNSCEAIDIIDGLGQLYTDYKPKNIIVPCVNGTITSAGILTVNNVNHSIIDNTINYIFPSTSQNGERYTQNPCKSTDEENHELKYYYEIPSGVSINSTGDITFEATSSANVSILRHGLLRVLSGTLINIETEVENNTSGNITISILGGTHLEIPQGKTKLFLTKCVKEAIELFRFRVVSSHENGTVVFSAPKVSMVYGEIKKYNYFGTTNYRNGLNTKCIGKLFIDTTLNKPFLWNGTAWVDATGATV